MDAPNYVLFDHAAGYALFSVKEFEDIGNMIPEVESASSDISRFASVVKLIAFIPFKDAIAALENCNAISEGVLTEFLLAFLESNIPQIKKKKMKLGVGESKLGSAISEAIEHVSSYTTGVVPEIIRGIRIHFSKLVQDLTPEVQGQAQLGLGHSYSRGKVKFNVHRVDNMIIQCIALCDQLDKDINTFCMRIREWYSYHFPELYKIVPDQYTYCRCAKLIGDRKTIDEAKLGELLEILMDEEKVNDVNEASKMSMGMDISVIDLLNIDRFASRVVALCEFRTGLKGYLTDRMDACAPSLRALVGARLISHAGSLTNLAKYPASTIQILGAEKALFRALKTKGNTPKYGLLFHSTYIGRAQAKNKGRISRYLANKCAIASRIDCFSEVPVPTFGEFLKQQVEDRLKFFETGQKVKKNVEVMHSAVEAAVDVAEKSAKKRKKRMKKEKKARQGMIDNITAAANASTQKVENGDEGTENEPPKKKKKMKKENMSETADINGDTTNEATSESGKKKKKRKMSVSASEKAESVASSSLSKKKRKRKQKS